MARDIYGNILPTVNGIVQNVDPNKPVQKPTVPPVEQQQAVEPVVQPTAGNLFKRNFFRVNPTPEQAAVVGASTKSQAEGDAERMALAQRPLQNTTPSGGVKGLAEGSRDLERKSRTPEDTLEWLASQVTTPEQEEKMRKASVANQRIMAIGDALRHIGNIYNTVNYAPAQKFNNPVQEEYDRYQKGKALRDAANMRYLNYMQAKNAQDQKIRQFEAEQMRKDKMDEWTIKKAEQQIKSQQEKDKRLEEMTAAKIAYQQGIIDEKEFNRKVKEYYMSLGLTPTGGKLGGSSGRSGGGSGKPTQWQTRYNDYDYAKQNGIPVMEQTTDILGNKTTKRRDPNVVHAEVEEHKRKNSGKGSGNSGRFSSLSIHKKK